MDNVVERCEGRIPSPEDVHRAFVSVQQRNSRSEAPVSRRGPPKVKHIITRCVSLCVCVCVCVTLLIALSTLPEDENGTLMKNLILI